MGEGSITPRSPGVRRRQGAETILSLAQDADGAAAESIGGVPTVVYHILGDEKFAKFLLAQPLPYRMMVRNRILSDGLMPPASLYLSRHFPQTANVLAVRRKPIDHLTQIRHPLLSPFYLERFRGRF